MLFVFTSHFCAMHFPADDALGEFIETVCKVASPSFMLISGFTVGYLFAGGRQGFLKLERILRGRGLFLLTIVHLLLALSQVPLYSFGRAIRVISVVDAIAVAFIVGVPLVRLLTVGQRMLLAIGLVGLSWVMTLFYQPQTVLGFALSEALWGSLDYRVFDTAFALLPWLAVYTLGTCVGERLGRGIRSGRPATRGLYLLGFSMIGAAIGVKLLYWGGVAGGLFEAGGLQYMVTSPYTKFPPGPVYILFFGGLSLIGVATVFALEARRRLRPAMSFLMVLGRTSLFLFVAQSFVYCGIMPALKTPQLPFWPLHLATSVVFLGALASVWNRRGYNRFLKVSLLASSPAPATITPTYERARPS